MRDIYLLTGVFLFAFSSLKAQTVLEFTIDQSPLLVANAGLDKTILIGTNTTLGGAPTATGGSGVYTYSWSPAEGLSQTNIANPVANPLRTTTYMLTVNDGKKCSITSSTVITVNSTLGVPDVEDEINLKIFPNPSNGNFLITSEKSLSNDTILIEVFNAIGMIIHSETVSEVDKLNKAVNLSNVSSGLYFLKLSGSELNIFKAIMIQ